MYYTDWYQMNNVRIDTKGTVVKEIIISQQSLIV